VFAAGVAVTLPWPGPVDLVWLCVLVAIAIARLARVQWSFYKKYVGSGTGTVREVADRT
jgi:hypothetical protein